MTLPAQEIGATEIVVRHYSDVGDNVGQHVVAVLLPGVPEEIRLNVGDVLRLRCSMTVEHNHKRFPEDFER